jgi:Trk K+ transport system NAD-binding subunit
VRAVEQDGRIRITAIRRSKNVMVAQGADVLQAGDEINAIVAPQALGDFAARFASAKFPITLTA